MFSDHVHIVAHVPRGKQLSKGRRWIKHITGKAYRRNVIDTGRIGGVANAAESTPEHFAINLLIVTEYALKGACRRDARAQGLWRWGEGGRVVGQRVGMSRNLSRAIRPHVIA